MKYGSKRFWRAHRYVLRQRRRYARDGEGKIFFTSLRAALASMRRASTLSDYEIARLPENVVVAVTFGEPPSRPWNLDPFFEQNPQFQDHITRLVARREQEIREGALR